MFQTGYVTRWPTHDLATGNEMYGQWGMNLLTVRPGITGLWQVSGRSDLSLRRTSAFRYALHPQLVSGSICKSCSRRYPLLSAAEALTNLLFTYNTRCLSPF